MTIRHKGCKILSEENFDQDDIYGKVGSLAVTLFGGPRRTSVEVNPDEDEVRVIASYGGYTLKGDEINYDSTCRQLGLSYSDEY